MALIKISNLSKAYGDEYALKDLSLTIEENKIYGLLGRNGAGKTTLLNLITNRIFPTEGSVTIDGKDIANNEDIVDKIYFMTEKDLYPDSMRVKELFKWTKNFYPNFDMEYALELSKKFGLNIKKKFKELSTGYSSISKIIVTLASGAEVLIFDEPVLGLDAHHREFFYKELIRNYTEEPKTIILSTHIIEEISNILEGVIIVKDKNILKNDDVENILSNSYTVSGLSKKVDEYINDKKCINIEAMANFKSATIMEKLSKEEKELISKLELEVSKVELQKLFIYLTGEEECK